MNADFPRMDRRAAIKWMMTAAAGLSLTRLRALAGTGTAAARGYGTDPNLVKPYGPGELWPLTFTDGQRRTAAALCNAIIPEDEHSPGAASLGVQDFIDEWISAPYPEQGRDRPVILKGLQWLESESTRRFGQGFAELTGPQQAAICDDICHEPSAKAEFRKAARFFTRFRDLAAGGFYTTPEGTRDLGYVGNIPTATFEGPPLEALKKAGLA